MVRTASTKTRHAGQIPDPRKMKLDRFVGFPFTMLPTCSPIRCGRVAVPEEGPNLHSSAPVVAAGSRVRSASRISRWLSRASRGALLHARHIRRHGRTPQRRALYTHRFHTKGLGPARPRRFGPQKKGKTSGTVGKVGTFVRTPVRINLNRDQFQARLRPANVMHSGH